MRKSFEFTSFRIFFWVGFLSLQPLLANWSTPPVVIYPSSSPYSATNPSIATDANGNSIAVWFDTSGSGSMHAATHAAGSVNGQGQPIWVLTDPIATSNVQAPTSYLAQSVGFGGEGEAIVAWTDGTHVYSSSLSSGQTSWSSPKLVTTASSGSYIENVNIAVATVLVSPPIVNSNTRAMISWAASKVGLPGLFDLHVAFFSQDYPTWYDTGPLIRNTTLVKSMVSQLAIDSNANAIIAMAGSSGSAKAQVYRKSGNFAIPSFSDSTTQVLYNSVAIDPSGNGTLVWVEASGVLKAATLTFVNITPTADYPITNVTTLSSNADPSSPPRVVTDQAGNVVALWTDQSGKVATARFSHGSSSWTSLPLLNVGNTTQNISLSGDANGNVVASWTLNGKRNTIQAASLLASTSSWGTVVDLSDCPYNNDNSQMTITPSGNALILWQNNIDSGTRGQILSSILINPFAESEK